MREGRRVDFLMDRISTISDMEIYAFNEKGGFLEEFNGDERAFGSRQMNPLFRTSALRTRLIEHSKSQHVPAIIADTEGIFWCAMQWEDIFLLGGPVAISHLNLVELRKFYRSHHISIEEEKDIPVMSFARYLSLICLAWLAVSGNYVNDDELVYGNGLEYFNYSQMHEEQIRDEIRQEEGEYHHSYEDERRLAEYIRSGDLQHAYELNRRLVGCSGRFSADDTLQSYNMSVIAITLCTRAAIEGGVAPAAAYQVSDFYIRRLHMADGILRLEKVVNYCIADLTEKVREIREKKHFSDYVEICKDYVAKHFREKISVSELAGQIGISSGHLTRLFRAETGVTIQEYIIRYRLKRAANMLKYSNETVGYISQYVNFSTQSYFGEQFRKYYHMTPKDYREFYKPAEWVE